MRHNEDGRERVTLTLAAKNRDGRLLHSQNGSPVRTRSPCSCAGSLPSLFRPTLTMDKLGINFSGSHSTGYAKDNNESSLLRLDMGTYQGPISDLLGTPYSQTRPSSAGSEFSLSPITPKNSFAPSGLGMDLGLPVRRNRTITRVVSVENIENPSRPAHGRPGLTRPAPHTASMRFLATSTWQPFTALKLFKTDYKNSNKPTSSYRPP